MEFFVSMILYLFLAYIVCAMGFYTLLYLRAPVIESLAEGSLPPKDAEIIELFPEQTQVKKAA